MANMRSWIESANEDLDFTIHNVPFGLISTKRDPTTRPATRLGNIVVDLKIVAKSGLLLHDVIDAEALATLTAVSISIANTAAICMLKGIQSIDYTGPTCVTACTAKKACSQCNPESFCTESATGKFSDRRADTLRGSHHASSDAYSRLHRLLHIVSIRYLPFDVTLKLTTHLCSIEHMKNVRAGSECQRRSDRLTRTGRPKRFG